MIMKIKKISPKELIYRAGGYKKVKKICRLKTVSAISQWVRRGRIPPLQEIKIYKSLGLEWEYQKS